MKALKKIILKLEMCICVFALAMVDVAVNFCRGMWYEPEIPEGMDEFIEKRNRRCS